ncbi:hypothetical protein E4T47_09552 [Aureobasidium subglaciale]|nr:hypothetical protein E4T47_09552 [Aureobasidium subglaciale]
MDEFAQTGAQQDDLFDDIQYDQSMQTRAPHDLFAHDIQPVHQDAQDATEPETQVESAVPPEVNLPTATAISPSDPLPASTESTPIPTSSTPSRSRGAARGRGRGRGRNNQDRSNQDRTNQDRSNQDRANQDRGNLDRRNQDRNNQDRTTQNRSNQDRNTEDRKTHDRKNTDRSNTDPRRNNQDRNKSDVRRNNQDRIKKDAQPKDAQPKDAQPKDAQPKDVQPKDAQPKDAQSRGTTEPQDQQLPAAPTEPSKPTTNAVRGDRTATGGLRKPKLSEQELADKMSKISLKNEKLAAAHARAEEDAANFAEREEVAAKRRQEERRDRQQMMGEREKNRLRKLKAVGGREWDAEKPDDADAFGGPRQPAGRGRGAHGGVTGQRNPESSREGFGGDKEDYTDGREYMYREDRGRGRGRRRGGRGGSGRGGRAPQQEKPSSQSGPRPEDFPDLSSSAPAPKFDTAPPPIMAFPTKAKMEKIDLDEQITPGMEKKSWADMMECITTFETTPVPSIVM